MNINIGILSFIKIILDIKGTDKKQNSYGEKFLYRTLTNRYVNKTKNCFKKSVLSCSIEQMGLLDT